MNNKPITLLLVEDNPGDARLLRESIAEAPNVKIIITHVDNLQKAYQKLKDIKFDIILLDLSLPDATGFEAFVWLYAQAPDIPIIILTGLDDEQLAVRAIRKGAQDYLVKGVVDSPKLMSSIFYAIERHHLKLDLKESEKKYSSIFETANDAIISADAETGYIIDANRKSEDLLGMPLHKIMGMHILQIYPEDQKDFYKKIFLDQVGKGRSVLSNLYVQNRNGQRVPVEISSSLAEIKGTMILQGIYRDITERKRIEKLKDEFVSAVSHELRTPLTSIREGVSQFLDGLLGDTSEEQKQFLNIILEDIDRLQQIIDELLDISKIESGRIELHKEKTDIVELISHILPRFHGFLKKEIEVITIMPKEGITLFFDPGKVTQVITNLLSNAFKFTDDGGKITIEIQDEQGKVQLCVSDTGVGIAKDNLPKIFEKFVQVDRTDGPGIKGTGLGLPISKSFVEMHSGEMWAESEVNEGTKIFFTIPKISAEDMFKEFLRNKIDEAESRETTLVFLLAYIKDKENIAQTLNEASIASLFSELKNLLQKNLHRSDDSVMEYPEGLAIFLIDTDKKGGTTVGKRTKEIIDDFLQKKGLQNALDIKLGISVYPHEEKYANNVIESAKKNLLEVDFRNVSIILIDDEEMFLEIMKIKMEKKGFREVYTAIDGEKALEIIQDKLPDVIVLDMNMPVMNGYEVIGRMKTNPLLAQIPVIILSGFPVDNRKLDEMGTKRIPVMSKPLDDGLFFENIEKVLIDNL